MRAVPSVLLAVLLLSALPVASSPASASVSSLFDAPAMVQGAAPRVPPRARVRQREVTARLSLLTRPDGSPALGAGERLHLNLFDDARFSMTVTDVARHFGGGFTWSGRLDGIGLGSAVLAVQDGALVGQVWSPAGVYRIGHAADGTAVVEEIDQAALPPEADPVAAGPADAGPVAAADAGPAVADAAIDAAPQIDVMVVYTQAARTAAGGPAAMLAEVNLAVATANQAYANNGLVQRVRLVYAGEVSIVESDFNADLNALRADPTVGWLRNMSRADLVTLITDHGPGASFCGIGFLMTANPAAFAANAFNVVERDCASANLTYPHELGHNMGAHHDSYVTGGEPTLFSYSHGYVDLVGKFRTVMAYNDQCASSGFDCARIAFFSTPGLTHNDRPIGTAATSDNARVFGQTAGAVANFRLATTFPLTLAAAVNQPAVAVGEMLTTSVSVDNAGTAGATGDFYLGLVLPGGAAVFFTDLTITPTSGYALGTITNFATYRPIARAIPLGAPFAASFPNFLSYQRAAGDPAGPFVLFVIVVTAGALADGSLATNELLAAALAPFALPAAAGGGGCSGQVCQR